MKVDYYCEPPCFEHDNLALTVRGHVPVHCIVRVMNFMFTDKHKIKLVVYAR